MYNPYLPALLLAVSFTLSLATSLPGHPNPDRGDGDNVDDDDAEPAPKCVDLATRTPNWDLTNGRWNTIGGGANTIWFDARSSVTGVSTYCQGSDGMDYDGHLEYAWHFRSDNKSEIRFRENEMLLDIRSTLACEGAEEEGDHL
ncbi:uncharacterized protein PG998_012683 [Apiospora kogelbergensis]|uniref:Uncharacterized protein n=1 Tax=Apiospora kogelbergensis TaxID=1337665 RepID=A0AAW0Q3U8_9PEZI